MRCTELNLLGAHTRLSHMGGYLFRGVYVRPLHMNGYFFRANTGYLKIHGTPVSGRLAGTEQKILPSFCTSNQWEKIG